MAAHKVIVCCWSCGHHEVMGMTLRQEQTLCNKIKGLKAVCPNCRDKELGNMPVFIKEGETLVSSIKLFKCRHGHITSVSAFTNGMLSCTFGPVYEDFFNIEGKIEDLEELIDTKDVSCHHVRENGLLCDCKLKAVDKVSLLYPCASNIKTKTRVGDLWDKKGIEPVKNGTYDGAGNYNATKTQVANLERLKRMRKRNVAKDKIPGERIDKPTKNDYGHKSKNEIDMN